MSEHTPAEILDRVSELLAPLVADDRKAAVVDAIRGGGVVLLLVNLRIVPTYDCESLFRMVDRLMDEMPSRPRVLFIPIDGDLRQAIRVVEIPEDGVSEQIG